MRSKFNCIGILSVGIIFIVIGIWMCYYGIFGYNDLYERCTYEVIATVVSTDTKSYVYQYNENEYTYNIGDSSRFSNCANIELLVNPNNPAEATIPRVGGMGVFSVVMAVLFSTFGILFAYSGINGLQKLKTIKCEI